MTESSNAALRNQT